jgi:hypothetical protein
MKNTICDTDKKTQILQKELDSTMKLIRSMRQGHLHRGTSATLWKPIQGKLEKCMYFKVVEKLCFCLYNATLCKNCSQNTNLGRPLMDIGMLEKGSLFVLNANRARKHSAICTQNRTRVDGP